MQEKGIKKLYYSIGEVNEMTGLETHVLRYWETEFKELKPRKNRAGHRAYTSEDILIVERIQYLLKQNRIHDQKERQKVLAVEESGDGSERMRRLVKLRRFLNDVLVQLEAG